MLSSNVKPPKLSRFLKPNVFTITLVIFLFITSSQAAVHSVLTYKNASTLLGQLVTSSTLVWETYDVKDAKQLQYAVEGGKYITEEENYPIYVCRVNIDGVGTIGHTEKIQQTHECKAAHYKNMRYQHFDVLINKGHLGKVSWKHWRKFNVGVPVGAIRIGEDAYIGRHRAVHSVSNAAEGEQQRGADFNLGRLDPMGLGKVKVMESNVEKEYDEGEVLVETEPFRYELKDIRLDQIRLDMRDNITELAFGVLANNGDKYSVVETILTYNFDHVQYWGSHEGLARGLPTKIFEKDSAQPAEINWGLKKSEKRFETKSVNTKLWPGTAINVTLKGNYVTLDAPYSAKLYAFYAGSEDSVSRKIKAEVRKSYLKDVKLELTNPYWIENGTFVPVASTTSTTSTTTHATTTSAGTARPIHEPPVVQMTNMGPVHSGPDSLEKSMKDEPSSSNEIMHDKPENMAAKHQNTALAGVGAPTGSATTATLQHTILFATSMASLLIVLRSFYI